MTFEEWYGEDLTGQTFNGNLIAFQDNLTSLKGCPKIVTGRFSCSRNLLTSLEFGPEEVHGDYYCYGNKLTTLKGCPKIVYSKFNCSDNKLTSLKGIQKIINGNFICENNKLKTLENFPFVNCCYHSDFHHQEIQEYYLEKYPHLMI